jgi:hypothetical protein
MFQDIGVSKNLIDQYRTYCENKKLLDIGKKEFCWKSSFNDFLCLVDFSVMVLGSNSWPFSAPPNFVLSAEVKFLGIFSIFYYSIFDLAQTNI